MKTLLVTLHVIHGRPPGQHFERLDERRLHRALGHRAKQRFQFRIGEFDDFPGQRRIERLRAHRDRTLLAGRLRRRGRRRGGQSLRGPEQFRPHQVVFLAAAPLLRFAAKELGLQILHPQLQPTHLRPQTSHFGGRVFRGGDDDFDGRFDSVILFYRNVL